MAEKKTKKNKKSETEEIQQLVSECEDPHYHCVVSRNQTLTYGPGVATVYQGERVLTQVPVITGGEKLDPKEYGGITPPVDLHMTSRIYPHQEEGGGFNGLFCVVVPADPALVKEQYPKRTWYRDGDRFKIHQGRLVVGSSTGCICPYTPGGMGQLTAALNQAYEHAEKSGYKLVISVEDAC